MKPLQRIPQIIPVEMRIDLRGGDAFVAEHFLYGAEVGAAFHEMGGEGVAEGVWRDAFGDARFLCQVFDDIEDHDPAQAFASFVEKNNVLGTRLHGLVYTYMFFV
jgi:hypothetical protein